ncbi:hypothetical protein EYF80_008041 [Liparis tanakae]|uniref:Uncharacterized protein n=1 Tax=Liparis tanakae TaxID=230148 RepID=A0A4Z2IUJ8_9TELE|nr:hypothetical protein EYF80_008041 [Liparis tanakae]
MGLVQDLMQTWIWSTLSLVLWSQALLSLVELSVDVPELALDQRLLHAEHTLLHLQSNSRREKQRENLFLDYIRPGLVLENSEQSLTGVFFQDAADLMAPLDHCRLQGVDDALIRYFPPAACSSLSAPAGRGNSVLPWTWPDTTNTSVLREWTLRLTSSVTT